jgi:hypothetical protein
MPKSRPDAHHWRDLDKIAFIISIINLTAGHQGTGIRLLKNLTCILPNNDGVDLKATGFGDSHDKESEPISLEPSEVLARDVVSDLGPLRI